MCVGGGHDTPLGRCAIAYKLKRSARRPSLKRGERRRGTKVKGDDGEMRSAPRSVVASRIELHACTSISGMQVARARRLRPHIHTKSASPSSSCTLSTSTTTPLCPHRTRHLRLQAATYTAMQNHAHALWNSKVYMKRGERRSPHTLTDTPTYVAAVCTRGGSEPMSVHGELV